MDTVVVPFLYLLVILGITAALFLFCIFIGSCMAVGSGDAPTKAIDITEMSSDDVEYLLTTMHWEKPTFTGRPLSKPFKHVPTNHATDRAAKDFPRTTSVRRVTH